MITTIVLLSLMFAPAIVTVIDIRSVTFGKTHSFSIQLYFTSCCVAVVEIIHIYYNNCNETQVENPTVYIDCPPDGRLKGLTIMTLMVGVLLCLISLLFIYYYCCCRKAYLRLALLRLKP